MPRTAEANEKIKHQRREKIRLGALTLFVRNGLAGTKISDIAKQVNMSNGLIYHYFSAKEAIYEDLIQTAFERKIQACEHLAALKMPPHQKIRHAMDELVKMIRSNPDACLYYSLVTQAGTSGNIPAAAKKLVMTHRKRPHEIIAGIIREGQAQGTIRRGRPEDYAFFFWNTVSGIAIHQAMYGRSALRPSLAPIYHMFFEEKKDDADIN